MATRTAARPASPKQVEWIDKKLAEHGLSQADMEERTGFAYADLTTKTAGTWLDILFNLPRPVAAGTPTVPGIYMNRAGEVAKVQKTQDQQRCYAKVLVAGRGFVYRANAIQMFKDTDGPISPEAARQYGITHGVCVNCGETLSDPLSVAIGLGTTCGPNIMGKDAYLAAKREAMANPQIAAAVKAHRAAAKALRDAALAATAATPARPARSPKARPPVVDTAPATDDADLLAHFGI